MLSYWKEFETLSCKKIKRFFGSLSAVTNSLGPCPSYLVKAVVNSLFSVGVVPLSVKEGVVCLLLNKLLLHQPVLDGF